MLKIDLLGAGKYLIWTYLLPTSILKNAMSKDKFLNLTTLKCNIFNLKINLTSLFYLNHTPVLWLGGFEAAID